MQSLVGVCFTGGVQEYWFTWDMTSGYLSLFFAMLGSTLDTYCVSHGPYLDEFPRCFYGKVHFGP